MPVYLIRAGASGPVKIGHARNPARRMAGFQTAHYERLTLLRTWPGGQPEEAALHRAFADFRMNGEWFRFCEAMLTADPAGLISPSLVGPLAPGELPSVLRVLEAMGGPIKAAEMVGVGRQAVGNWRKYGFGLKAAVALLLEAERQGFQWITPAVLLTRPGYRHDVNCPVRLALFGRWLEAARLGVHPSTIRKPDPSYHPDPAPAAGRDASARSGTGGCAVADVGGCG